MIEIGQSYRRQLLQLKEKTREAGLCDRATSDLHRFGPHTVRCESELAVSKGHQAVQRNSWFLDDVRVGENHLFTRLRQFNERAGI